MDELFSSVNHSEFHSNFHLNESDVTDLYEVYRENEKNRLLTIRWVGLFLGIIIMLSNLPVVVSSGLILRKGQKPRSTYMLLGNVSLADTIVGSSLIFGLIGNTKSPSTLCIIQMGTMVCPAMVSIFSVGLIAVDRYIYILHGLYYQRWFNTTRVRIGIVLIWAVGITLGFMPATGWISDELNKTRCLYVSLFPGSLILLNSFLSIIPIVVVVVLYTIILVKALKTVNTINGTIKVREVMPTNEKPILRINRGTVVNKSTIDNLENNSDPHQKLKRSISFTLGTNLKIKPNCRSKSIEELTCVNSYNSIKDAKQCNGLLESKFSVSTFESMLSFNVTSSDIERAHQANLNSKRHSKFRKSKEPNKWRAIKVVMLTTGTFIVTWIPFFISVIFFVFCEDKLTNPKCIHLRFLLGGPLPILAFTNSMVNPLIYAWWHKGFNKAVKTYYSKYFRKYFCHEFYHNSNDSL